MKPTPEILKQENALAERAAGYWLLGAAVVVLLPHAMRLPVWLSAVLAALFAWRLFMLQRAWPAPNRWLRWLLTVLLVFALYREYGTLFGRDAGSALLAAMLALKFLELQRLRDYVLSVLLIYFLIVIGFLYSQAMWLVVYLLAVFVLTTATLIRLAVPGARALCVAPGRGTVVAGAAAHARHASVVPAPARCALGPSAGRLCRSHRPVRRNASRQHPGAFAL